MTTPSTEPILATDSKIERHKHCHSSCDGSEGCVCGHDLSGVTHYALIARIEQEREMRRGLRTLLTELDTDRNFRLYVPYIYQDQVEALLARAAKMEADYGK